MAVGSSARWSPSLGGLLALGPVAAVAPAPPRPRPPARPARAPTAPASPSSSTRRPSVTGCRCGAPRSRCSSASTRSRGPGSPSRARTQFPGLLCRIDGEPAPTIPATARRRPTRTGPTGTHPAGGSWTYSTSGAGSRMPPPGSVEGWAFGDDAEPGVDPPARRADHDHPPADHDHHRRRPVAPAGPTARPTAATAADPTTDHGAGRRRPTTLDHRRLRTIDDHHAPRTPARPDRRGRRRRRTEPAAASATGDRRRRWRLARSARSSGLVAVAGARRRRASRGARRRRSEEGLGLMARGCRARCTRARGGSGRSAWRRPPAARPTRSCCC